MKFCSKCKVEKPLSQFSANSRKKDGLDYQCASCRKAYQKAAWAKLSPEKKKARHESGKRWDAANPMRKRSCIRKNWMWLKYGLTQEHYALILTKQGHQCAICDGALIDSPATHIDHDHKTGKVRGILCRLCNTALGKFRDSEALLERAIEYLRKNK